MNNPVLSNRAYQSLTDQQLIQIDVLCDRFDSELVSGVGPRIECYLEDAPEGARDGLLSELLAIELEHWVSQKIGLEIEDYFRRFPEQKGLIIAAFQVLAASLDASDKSTWNQPHETVRLSQHTPTGINLDVDSTFVKLAEFSNFRLLEELGRGGMGVVWLAEQSAPIKRKVALKLIKPELASKQFHARFEAERQALALMEHPNIAKVFEAGTKDGSPYLVMEYVDGLPLTTYCDQSRLSVVERLKVFERVCKAVQHAHQKGILHRDLKPSNILVSNVDGENVPKIIDFGLAKAAVIEGSLAEKSVFTEFGMVVGTPQYMSPEQTELKRNTAHDLDTRTDIYSLGVVLYELLTSTTPVDRESIERTPLLDLLELIRSQEPQRPSSRLCSFSHEIQSEIGERRKLTAAKLLQALKGDLDWIVMRALEKDRTRRYQSAHEFAMDLSNYLVGQPITARPPSTWYQVQKFTQRNRGLVVAALSVCVAVSAGFAGTTFGLLRANKKAAEAEDQRILADHKSNEAEASAARSNQILSIVSDAFDAPNPDTGATVGTLAKDVLIRAKENLNDSELDDEGRLQLLRQLHSSFRGLGELDEAIDVTEQWQKLSLKILGPSHPDTLTAMSKLAYCYSEAGRLEQANQLWELTLERCRTHLGHDHTDSLLAMKGLAIGYYRARRLDEAIAMNEETLELTRAKLGPLHEDTIDNMGNLAVGYRMAGRARESIELMEPVLEYFAQELGSDHPKTLTAMNMLATQYAALERYDEAIELNTRTLELQKAKLGADHPDSLKSLGNLALVYARSGEIDRSAEMFETLLNLNIAKLGINHPDTLQITFNLARDYHKLERHDDAIDLIANAVKSTENELGFDNQWTLEAMAQLANAYQMAGKLQEAIELGKKTLQLRRTKLGPNDQDTHDSLKDLAITYRKARQIDQALELRKERLNLLIEKLGYDHSDTVEARNYIAEMLIEFPECLPKLETVIESLVLNARNSPSVLTCRALSVVEYRRGNFEASVLAANSSTTLSSGKPHPICLALLCLSHHRLSNVVNANNYRELLVESMQLEEYKNDRDCIILMQEVRELYSGLPNGTGS